eukprot:384222-Rhodomonas_salina.1
MVLPVDRLTTATPAVYLKTGTTAIMMSITALVACVPRNPILILLISVLVRCRTASFSARHDRVSVVQHP